MKIFTPNTIISSTDVNANFVEATNRQYVGTFLTGATGANTAVTGVGFTPKYVQFFTTFATSTTGTAMAGYGYMRDDGTQMAYSQATRITTTNRSARTLLTDRCFLALTLDTGGTASTSYDGSFVSMDADGFTINNNTGTANNTVMFIAFG